MITCTMRLRSASKIAPVPRKPFIGGNITLGRLLGQHIYNRLITGKILRPNIVFIYAHVAERSTRCGNHCWRSSYVIDGASQSAYACQQHFRTDVASLPLPTVVVGRAREGRNKSEPWIFSL